VDSEERLDDNMAVLLQQTIRITVMLYHNCIRGYIHSNESRRRGTLEVLGQTCSASVSATERPMARNNIRCQLAPMVVLQPEC
jgi:hypothetical protein